MNPVISAISSPAVVIVLGIVLAALLWRLVDLGLRIKATSQIQEASDGSLVVADSGPALDLLASSRSKTLAMIGCVAMFMLLSLFLPELSELLKPVGSLMQ